MNSIPLIKGNTPQEINTSIIALKKALDNLQATSSEDLQKRIDEINAQIETLNQQLEGIDTHLNTIDGQITDLQPVDAVTGGNMHSVTSNAVASAMSDQFVNIVSNRVDLTIPANTGTSGSFTFTVPSGYKVISFNGYITSGPAGAINLYSFGFPYGKTGTFSTNIFFRNYTSTQQTAELYVYLLCARV